MAETPVPITTGNGSASIAGDLVSGNTYQQIKLVDGTIGGNTPLKINADGSITASVYGNLSVSAAANQSVSGTVQTQVQASVAVVIIGGSILTSSTPNQSVSGTVGANITNTVSVAVDSVNAGSVPGTSTQPFNFVFNGGTWDRQRGNSSIGTLVSTGASSVITIISGNASVSGTVGASIIGTVPVNIVSGGSNGGSVSGTVGASIIGLPPFVLGGSTNASVITVGGSGPANQSVSGTVGASIIGLPPFVLGGSTNASIITVGVANQSVSGTVGASIIGLPPFALNVQSGGPVSGGYVLNDATSSSFGIAVGNYPLVFNGATWDRQRGSASIGTLVMPYAFPSSLVSGVTSVITSTSSVQVLAPAPAGSRNYITNVLVTNAAAVGTTVQLLDAGQVIYVGYAAASGGGFAVSFPAPLKQSSIAGNLSALTTVQASVFVSASGYTAA